MKKICLLIICIVLFTSFRVFADDTQILLEKMSSLWLSPENDRAVLDNMYAVNEEKANEAINLYLMAPGFAREKVGVSTDDEKMKKQVADWYRIDENSILKVHYIEPNKYSKEYAENNAFRYLISNDYYWAIRGKETIISNLYTANGMIAEYGDFKTQKLRALNVLNTNFDFLQDAEKVITALQEIPFEKIKDIKFIILEVRDACLYIDCGDKEYLLRTNIGTYSKPEEKNNKIYYYVEELELYKLYDAKEFFEVVSDSMNEMNVVKPTYEAEATALYNEGLLKGNENGLDLLKPLSRIEAATMLLRALGKSEVAQDNSLQTFDDVPKSHWGYAAAENAYNFGLIKGIGDNKFAPDEPVTAAQFSTMVLRAANEPEFDWEQALNMLIEKGVITAENAETMDLFTRGDMAKIIYEMRANGLFK